MYIYAQVWPKDAEITPKEAADRLRYSYLDKLKKYMQENQVRKEAKGGGRPCE